MLVLSAIMVVPAFAQEQEAESVDQDSVFTAEEQEAETADQGSVFTADFCPTLEQDSAVWELMLSMFPSLSETCGAETQPVSV